MKKNKTVILLLSMAVVLLGVTGVMGFYLYQENQLNNPKKQTMNEAGLQTFADLTEVEQFQDLPVYAAEGVTLAKPEDRGDNVYMVTVNGTSKEQYEKREAKSFVESKFNGSLRNFLVALSGNRKLNENTIREFKDWLNEFDD